MTNRNTLRLTVGSLLLAISLLIPTLLGGVLSLPLGPFTATPASHVPLLLSLPLGPAIAGIVGFGSALGFFLKMGPLVGARAAMHMPVGILGAYLLRKKMPFPYVLAAIAPVHAGLEALTVLLFGFTLGQAGWLVGVGTLAHHTLDSLITLVIWHVAMKRTSLSLARAD